MAVGVADSYSLEVVAYSDGMPDDLVLGWNIPRNIDFGYQMQRMIQRGDTETVFNDLTFLSTHVLPGGYTFFFLAQNYGVPQSDNPPTSESFQNFRPFGKINFNQSRANGELPTESLNFFFGTTYFACSVLTADESASVNGLVFDRHRSENLAAFIKKHAGFFNSSADYPELDPILHTTRIDEHLAVIITRCRREQVYQYRSVMDLIDKNMEAERKLDFKFTGSVHRYGLLLIYPYNTLTANTKAELLQRGLQAIHQYNNIGGVQFDHFLCSQNTDQGIKQIECTAIWFLDDNTNQMSFVLVPSSEAGNLMISRSTAAELETTGLSYQLISYNMAMIGAGADSNSTVLVKEMYLAGLLDCSVYESKDSLFQDIVGKNLLEQMFNDSSQIK